MKTTSTHRLKFFGRLLTIAALGLALLTTNALAGKGGKGKPGGGGGESPAGSVYFLSAGEPYVMDADGNNVQPLPSSTKGYPTAGTPGGSTWFLRLEQIAGTYPNGDPQVELVAVREDGAAAVTLVSDPFLQPLVTSPYYKLRSFRWATDNGVTDGKISFGARLWNSDGTVDEQGLYQASVAFDGNGEISGAGMPQLLLAVNDGAGDNNHFLDIADHSWSPDGTMVAFTTRVTSDLYVMDTVTGQTNLLVEFVQFPAWSPDGAAIAFTSNDGLETIDLATLNRTLHVETIVRKNSVTAPEGPTWLPGGDHIVYVDYSFNLKNGSGSDDVRRFNLIDGSDIALTSDGASTVIESR